MNADNIKDLFNPEKIEFSIPDYQRAYSWEDKNIDQFIQDILDNASYKKRYYLGHYLFERDTNRPEKLLVIDGQQRLTTIVIFMSCVYKELKKRSANSIILDKDEDSVNIERIREDFIKYSKFYKLSTVSDDNPFFESVIYNEFDVQPENQSQRRIAKAKAIFTKWLSAPETNTADILEYKDIIAEAAITTYEVKDKYQATQIFAFQNDRGKSLTELEKLKAEIMHKIYTYSSDDDEAARAVDYVKVQFAKIFKCVERFEHTDEDAVLNAHNLAFYPSNQTALSFLKNKIKVVESDPVEWIKHFTDTVLNSYQSVLKIESKYSYDSKIADIQILDKYNSTPLLLKLFHFHGDNDLLIEEMSGYVERTLFKLTFRADDFRTNSLIGIARDYQGDAEALRSSLIYSSNQGFKWYWNFNQSCHNYFSEGHNHYNSKIKYVLWKFENALRKEKRISPISPEVFINQFGNKREENTLDHIMPQDPNFTTYPDDFIKLWLNNIGNLSLMGWGNNSAKRNNDPIEIKEYYNSNYLSMQLVYHTLCERQKWGEEEIKERQELIIDFVDKNWIQ